MVAILHPVGPGYQIPIDRAVVLVGRSPECDIVLDMSTKISRMHCALVQVDKDYYIRDLGSMNGISVGGKRVKKDVKLTNGIEVVIGDVKFLFLENVTPGAKSPRQVPGKGRPVLIDERVDVVDVADVEIIRPGKPAAGPGSSSATIRSANPGGTPRRLKPNVPEPEFIENPEVIEMVEEVEIVEDVEVVDVLEHVELVEDVEVVEDVEIIDDVIEVVDDVEVIDNPPRRPPHRNR